ncbi:unnamed protein product [Somion occarium]|uniref:Uncharacterized protein n=1 Tax=Somion occarium TaxID=3059160 RepID=A0ABP1DV85_9APHY
MFSRSAAVANQSVDAEVRRGMRSGKVIRNVPKTSGTTVALEVSGSTTPSTSIGFGFDSTIMERLENALASPFSPKSLRSFLPNSPTVTSRMSGSPLKPRIAGGRADARVVSLKPRKKGTPKPLPLNQPSRLSEQSPLSPFKYSTYVETKATLAPISPSAVLSKLSPVPNVTSMSEADIRKQKMEKLARCLGETGPQEMVFPSFGQVGAEVQGVPTYLDLYRQHSAIDDSVLMNLKSPAPRDSKVDWATLDDIETKNNEPITRKSMLRRSRSVGDFYSAEEILEMRQVRVEAVTTTEAEEGMRSAVASVIKPVEEAPMELRRKQSIANAKASILGDDAKLMADFRSSFKPRPLDLSLDFSNSPLPSPPAPSGFEVRSPRAPYWVKPIRMPKTPRTLRTERRQGWGGKWDFVETMGQLKQL